MGEELNEEQRARVWDHRLHMDTAFYNRLNFFLVFESVLLGIVGVLYSKPNSPLLVVKATVLLGLSLSIIWAYIQVRHKQMLDDINARSREIFPDYRATMERRAKNVNTKLPFHGTWLLAYIVPLLILLVWVFLLFFL
jgi:hypothetical protein